MRLQDTHRFTRVALLGLMAIGLALRVRGLDQGFAPDEFANVHPGTPWDILVDAESAVNPPLLRWLGNVGWGDLTAMTVGRLWSVLGSTLAIPGVFWLTLRASRNPIVALTAAALLTVAPTAVVMGARFRSYGLWSCFAAVHLLALSFLAEGDDEPRAERLAMGSAILLAWTHYLTVPLALLLAPAAQLLGLVPRAVRIWVPAAVTLAPMALLVFGVSETRVATPGSLLEGLGPILSGSLEPVPGLPPGLPDWREHRGAAYLAGLVAITPLAWRWLPPTARLTTLASGALFGSVLGMGLVQFVRSPVGGMWLVVALPTIGGLFGLVRHPWRAGGLAVGVGVLLAAGIPQVLERKHGYTPETVLLQLSTTWHDYDRMRRDGDLFLYPGSAWTGMHLYLTGNHVRDLQLQDPCETEACFVADGVPIRFFGERAPGEAGVLIAIETTPPEDALAGCTRTHEARFFSVWLCE